MVANSIPTKPEPFNPGRTRGEQMQYALGVFDGQISATLNELERLAGTARPVSKIDLQCLLDALRGGRAALEAEYGKGLH